MTVDGKKYPLVGARFRGMSSFGMVAAGSKRSLNLSVDLADEKQRLLGYKTLNLLNAHEDPSFISTVLYSQIARKHIAAPKANLVKVVINGESWGIYANVQQFNKEFMIDNFKSPKGARWKVSGSPGGRGGLEYTGDNVEDYKRRFEIKSADKKESWQALINLCRVLNQTPPENLKTELEKILDIDGLLWFLALDIGLINRDGYWIRSSDYSIALDEKGKFHILPHDMNEAFHAPHGPGMGGPGGRGGPGGGPGGFPAPPKPTDIFPFFLRDMLELDDAQRKKLDALQKDTDTKLEALFTPEQRKQLEEMKNAPPMVFPFPGGPGGGPGGFGGGPGGGQPNMGSGLEINPLAGLTDPSKPLRSKIFAVPELKQAYLAKIRQLAQEDLDWAKMAPTVKALRDLVDAEIKADTRKLTSYQAFLNSTADSLPEDAGRSDSLRHFFEARRKFLLNFQEAPRGK
jgi:spore coat protein CotH